MTEPNKDLQQFIAAAAAEQESIMEILATVKAAHGEDGETFVKIAMSGASLNRAIGGFASHSLYLVQNAESISDDDKAMHMNHSHALGKVVISSIEAYCSSALCRCPEESREALTKFADAAVVRLIEFLDREMTVNIK